MGVNIKIYKVFKTFVDSLHLDIMIDKNKLKENTRFW